MDRTRYLGAILRHGPDGWRAEINRGGHRYRARCASEKAAKRWVDRELPGIMEGARPLAAAEASEYRAALKLLPAGVGLLDAVAGFRPAEAMPDTPLRDAAARFIADKEAAGLRPVSVSGLRWSMKRLNAALGARPVWTVKTADLLPVLDGMHPTTRGNHRRAWSTFFRWCIASGLTTADPANGVAPVRADEAEPGILTVPRVRALLRAAERVDGGKMAAYLAVGFFSGIRSAALERLEWVDFRGGLIHVRAAIDKQRSARYVEIRPNLAAWVAKYRRRGRVCPYHHKQASPVLKAIRRRARLRVWPKNAMRHSFASYLLALVQDPGKTAHELGQRSPDMLFQHYRALVTQAQAEAYFGIMPAKSVPRASRRKAKRAKRP